jgi:hypothetical protein
VVEAHNIALGARFDDYARHGFKWGAARRCSSSTLKDLRQRFLRGAELTLAEPDLRCVIVELNGSGPQYGYDESVITDKMRNIGFEVCNYAPFERELRQGVTSGCSGNTLFVGMLNS